MSDNRSGIDEVSITGNFVSIILVWVGKGLLLEVMVVIISVAEVNPWVPGII